MHTIETSVIMAIVIYFYATLITHVFKWEVEISKDINKEFNRIKMSHITSGDKEYYPENVLRIITSVNEYLKNK